MSLTARNRAYFCLRIYRLPRFVEGRLACIVSSVTLCMRQVFTTTTQMGSGVFGDSCFHFRVLHNSSAKSYPLPPPQ